MTKGKLLYAQTLVLLAGTIFAWFTVYTDFVRFFSMDGALFKVSGTFYPHPITTTCFYGAIAFLVALVWSLVLLRMQGEERRARSQEYLVWFLLLGVAFAWTSFSFEAYGFYVLGDPVGCSGIPIESPFKTPCFYGSVLFLASLITAWITNKKTGREYLNENTPGDMI